MSKKKYFAKENFDAGDVKGVKGQQLDVSSERAKELMDQGLLSDSSEANNEPEQEANRVGVNAEGEPTGQPEAGFGEVGQVGGQSQKKPSDIESESEETEEKKSKKSKK